MPTLTEDSSEKLRSDKRTTTGEVYVYHAPLLKFGQNTVREVTTLTIANEEMRVSAPTCRSEARHREDRTSKRENNLPRAKPKPFC
jgi:hypothetical protein